MKLTVFSLLLVSLFLFGIATSAVASATNQGAQEFMQSLDASDVSGDVNSNVHTVYTSDAREFRFGCRVIGYPCSEDPKKVGLNFQNSVIGKVNGTIAGLYKNKPADTSQFIAYYTNKLNPVQPAFAQGIGFTGLSPLLGLWRVFRNIAYAFLIVIMVIVGFMVMFRMKLDPRTVISIQNAIPRIVVTLFLITFSYAIVGLMIDLMYLVIFLTVTTIGPAAGFGNLPELITRYTGGTTWELLGSSFTTGKAAMSDISNLFGLGSGVDWTLTGALALGGLFTANPIVLLSAVAIAASELVFHANPIVVVLVSAAVLFVFIRILFSLITAYIQIIISLIFGPLQLMFGAIPNVDAFGSWFKNLLANIAVFPIIMGMMFLAMSLSNIAAATTNLWRPPGLAGSVGGAVGSGMSGIITLGILFMAPSIAGQIKEALKTKPLVAAGPSALFSPLTSAYGTAMGGASNIYYLKMLGLKNPFKKGT